MWRKGTSACYYWKCKLVQPPWKQYGVSLQIKKRTTYDPGILWVYIQNKILKRISKSYLHPHAPLMLQYYSQYSRYVNNLSAHQETDKMWNMDIYLYIYIYMYVKIMSDSNDIQRRLWAKSFELMLEQVKTFEASGTEHMHFACEKDMPLGGQGWTAVI